MAKEFVSPERENLWVNEFNNAVLGLTQNGFDGGELHMKAGRFHESGGLNDKIYSQEVIVPDESADEDLGSVINVATFEEQGKKFLSLSFYLTPFLDGKGIPQKVLKYFSATLPDYALRLDILHNNTRANMLESMQKSMEKNPEGWKTELAPQLLAFADRSLKGSGYIVTGIKVEEDLDMGVLPVVFALSEKRLDKSSRRPVEFEEHIGLAQVEDTLNLTEMARGHFDE